MAASSAAVEAAARGDLDLEVGGEERQLAADALISTLERIGSVCRRSTMPVTACKGFEELVVVRFDQTLFFIYYINN